MNDKRREPKGIPAGGEFAKEAGAVPNADDLDRNDARLELPGCLAVGEGWTLDPLSTGANNQYRFTDDEGGMLETQDDDWFDPNLGDCSSRSAKYVSPRGDKVVAYDMKGQLPRRRASRLGRGRDSRDSPIGEVVAGTPSIMGG